VRSRPVQNRQVTSVTAVTTGGREPPKFLTVRKFSLRFLISLIILCRRLVAAAVCLTSRSMIIDLSVVAAVLQDPPIHLSILRPSPCSSLQESRPRDPPIQESRSSLWPARGAAVASTCQAQSMAAFPTFTGDGSPILSLTGEQRTEYCIGLYEGHLRVAAVLTALADNIYPRLAK